MTAARAEEAWGGIGAAAGWMRVAERGADTMAVKLCMVAGGVRWVVEEWGEAEAGALSWRLAAREVEEEREAERALWRRREEEERRLRTEDRELVEVLERALAAVAAEVEVAAEVAVRQRHGEQRGG